MSFWWNKRNGGQHVVYSASGLIGLVFYAVTIIIALIVLNLTSRN